MRALASPTSLKGVLSAGEAAAALARGLRRAGAEAEELPLADGGEGTARGARREGRAGRARCTTRSGGSARRRCAELPDGTVVVESAEACRSTRSASTCGLPRAAGSASCSRALGPCPRAAGLPRRHGHDGRRRRPAGGARRAAGADDRSLRHARRRCFEAPRLFGPQKGALADDVAELEGRFALLDHAVAREAPGRRRGGRPRRGARLARRGARSRRAPTCSRRSASASGRARADLVVTGEGTVDRTTFEGKAPGEAVRVCEELGVRCVLFGGRVEDERRGGRPQRRSRLVPARIWRS